MVVVGSLLGQWAGIKDRLGELWFWLGHQGWEYLEIGRFWQILLAAGLLFWFWLVRRAVEPARRNPELRTFVIFFLIAAFAIPFFYLPAFFFGAKTHYSIVDVWRFWIIHLWVEGFFEFFVTVIVAIILFQLGLVRRITAIRVIYLDAILYFGGGLIGTAHHWYFTGQTELAMALGATFSALEVVPLTLLTLDAWDFYRLTRGESAPAFRHRWTFYFLMAVGFWNFVGAGVFGFLINMPIVSYYEVGTILTVNHGHAAFIGVFGMLGVGLMAYVLREVTADELWPRVEKFLKVGFWGLNIGLAMMIVFSLFPVACCSSGTSCRTATGTHARSNTLAPRSRAPSNGCARRRPGVHLRRRASDRARVCSFPIGYVARPGGRDGDEAGKVTGANLWQRAGEAGR